jgi:SAM-dependent methyltransferase
MHCPICHAADTEPIHALACGNFDGSELYPAVNLKNCTACGHVFNELTPDELIGLGHYYDNEYAPANVHAGGLAGDRPGSSDNLTSDRYDNLYSALAPHAQPCHEILDVGCAMGGFLDYLGRKGFGRLSGVDMTKTYVDAAREKNKYTIELGSAEDLPFDDASFDVIVMEQVLEHLVDPIKGFQETRRVLKKNGLFCVGVPDASKYAERRFFDFYWLLLREHIQHFDINHLDFLGRQEGFEMLDYRQTAHAVMSRRMVMPNLTAVFKASDKVDRRIEARSDHGEIKRQMTDYVNGEKSSRRIHKNTMRVLAESRRPVYIWGIGREFLYLYESAGLKRCAIAGLIDSNQFKQKSCSVNGMKISDNIGLQPSANEDSALLITAIAHTDPIVRAARSIGFKGEIMTF